jgi:diguanylate cyclase
VSEIVSPAQIARETLRRLSNERRAPTPDNYRDIYDAIAGVAMNETDQAEEHRLRAATDALLSSGRRADLVTLLDDAAAERTWRRSRAALAALAQAHLAAGSAPAPTQAPPRPAGPAPGALAQEVNLLRGMLVRLLESRLLSPLSHEDDLIQESRVLAGRARTVRNETEFTVLDNDLRRLRERAEARAEETREVRDGLVRLLRLLVDQVSEMVVEDTWITHQLGVVREIMARPVTGEQINEAERFLREVLHRQGSIKRDLRDTKAGLRQMVADFVSQIGTVSSETGEYGRKMEGYAERIRGADDIRALSALLGEILRDTRAMQERAVATHKDMLEARDRARSAETRIQELERELLSVSDKIREDHLTGALNRRGFDEAFERETARARRTGHSLCVALLDLDNFKHVNDRYGHRAGDEALVHLAQVVKATIRPNDIVARYGGEEFLILLPEAALSEAEAVLVRLQRDLTKRFFLHNNERILVTFSAGVTEWAPHEDQAAVIARADAAQYEAKVSGKNRVVTAAAPRGVPQG